VRYFELAVQPDPAAYLAQFTSDAVVEDENRRHQGVDEIRAWRAETPQVSYTVKSIEARAEIAGDFPGSPVTLSFQFGYAADGRIKALRITG
jgi:hypothetical protein